MLYLLLALIPVYVLLLSRARHRQLWSRLRAGQRQRLLASLDRPDGLKDRTIVAFFHPYCNAGGGGERVLWTALSHMQRTPTTRDHVYVVYTGDRGVTKDSMISKVKDRFGIELDPKTLAFVFLEYRSLVEDSTWKRFTLAGQSFGSVLLALEALWWHEGAVVPDVWIDTMGYAFTYPLVKRLCRIPVASYTHYPTISTDMLDRVAKRQSGHTNQALVSRSIILTALKLGYYRLFARAYERSLSCADLIWVNSTWTRRHIEKLLSSKPPSRNTRPIRLLYPPCDTKSLATLPLSSPLRNPQQIISLAQFRPEKEHALQLEALSRLFSLDPKHRSTVRLVMAGSVRNEGDEARVLQLKALARSLGIHDQVEFRINEDWTVLRNLLGSSGIGLHTMFDEHFGITLVEFQAAGLISVAHASAGPLLDILVPFSPSPTVPEGPTGYLASSVSREDLAEEFAKQLDTALRLSGDEQEGIRARARENAKQRFGTTVFEEGWESGWTQLMSKIEKPDRDVK